MIAKEISIKLATNVKREKMKTETLHAKLKGIFPGFINGSELDGGQFIEDTMLYKTIAKMVSSYKPKTDKIEPFAFDFALTKAAIELYNGRGLYHAEAYKHYFEQSISIFHNDYVKLLNYHGLLHGFQTDDIEILNTKWFAKNSKTEEVLTFDTIEKIGLKWIEYELTIQINTIKLILNRKENRDQIIKLIAGNEKEEYISSATKIFEDIIQL